jgi:hypothetical protein
LHYSSQFGHCDVLLVVRGGWFIVTADGPVWQRLAQLSVAVLDFEKAESTLLTPEKET